MRDLDPLRQTPHPALRATLSHKGGEGETYASVPPSTGIEMPVTNDALSDQRDLVLHVHCYSFL
jgi:hypothetical protein